MNSPFKVDPAKKPSKGVETGDLYYHTAEIIQKVEDNEIKLVVEDNKELIADVIGANANKCGLKNILALYAKTGDVSLFKQQPVLNNFDATKIPSESIEELSKKLPSDLVGDDLEKFLKTITAQDLIEFYKKKNESEVKVDEQEK